MPYFVGIMGKVYESLTPALREWIEKQKVFFVATAPLSGEGHINCSPKGLDTFRVIGDREVAYLDLTGSGIETIAHLRENGRIVILFCAFEGPPLIVRLHGKGEVVYPGDVAFSDLMKHFPENAGTRAILRVRVTRVSDSCGFGVPLYEFAGPRDVLDRFAETKGPAGLTDYRREVNRRSIDGLPAYEG